MYTLWLLPLHKRLKEKSIQDDGKKTELQKIFKWITCFKGLKFDGFKEIKIHDQTKF